MQGNLAYSKEFFKNYKRQICSVIYDMLGAFTKLPVRRKSHTIQ